MNLSQPVEDTLCVCIQHQDAILVDTAICMKNLIAMSGKQVRLNSSSNAKGGRRLHFATDQSLATYKIWRTVV